MRENENVISIIVPIYKVEKYLRKCLDSIVNQTYRNLEIILVDDGSPDESGKICDEYEKIDNRIKVIHKKNGGVSSARNVGLKNATGKYVTFVDADDWIDLNMYEEMLNVSKRENVDIVRCSYCREYKNETVYPNSIFSNDEKIDLEVDRTRILRNLLSGKMHAYLVLFLIKRDKIANMSLFNTKLAMREDFIWGVELMFYVSSMYILNQPYYHYFQNPNSVTNSLEVKRKNMESMIVVQKELEKILEKYHANSHENQEVFATYFLSRVSSDLAIILYQEKKMDALNLVMQDKSFKTIILKAESKNLSKMNRIFFFFYKRNMKKLIYCFCIFKEYLRKTWIRKV